MAILCGEHMRIAKNRSSSALVPLPKDFYARDPRAVSRDLLGKVLVRRQQRKLLTARIVEVEAYLGQDDPSLSLGQRTHSPQLRPLRPARPHVRLFHLWQSLLLQRLLPA